MEKQIKKITAPYIVEGLFGLLENFVIGLLMLLVGMIGGIDSTEDLLRTVLPAAGLVVVLAILLDFPLIIKCLIDRKKQECITISGELENISTDWNYSYKVRLSDTYRHRAGICVRYYPMSWQMERYKLIIRTKDGRLIKPRGIASITHGQYYNQALMYSDEKELGANFVLKVRYLKHSKAIIDASLESHPESADRDTVEHARKTLAEITRWTVKSH